MTGLNRLNPEARVISKSFHAFVARNTVWSSWCLRRLNYVCGKMDLEVSHCINVRRKENTGNTKTDE